MHRARILVATTDPTLGQSLAGALDNTCDVQAAENGLTCLDKLRADPPDLLVLAPPLLWGSERGVLAVMQEEPALQPVPILYLAESDMFRPTAETDPPPGLSRIVQQVCHTESG